MSYLANLLQAPVFPDDDRTRTARALHWLLLTMILCALIYLPFSLFVSLTEYRWALVLGASGLSAGMLRALHLGHVKTVAAAVSLILWTIFTVTAFARGGIQAPGFAGYTAAILVAGMTVNWRAGLALTVLSSITGLAIVYAQTNGIIDLHEYHPLEIWAAGSAFFAVIALVSKQTVEELVQTKRILQQKEREYRSLVENSTDFIVRIDPQLRYRFVSASLSREIGIAFEDYVGKTNRELNMPDDLTKAWDGAVSNVFETRNNHSLEFTFPAEEGPLNFHARLTPEFDSAGRVESVLGIIRDITDLKQAQQAMLEAQRIRIELEQSRELIELKESFIATASHDFRTPLTIIKSDAYMLQRYTDRLPPETQALKLVQIQKQVDRMIDLLNAVLTLNKANAGKIEFLPKVVDLELFCRNVWDDMTRIDDQKHPAQLRYQADVKQVMMDETLLQYILVNLLSNAFKYTPAGGEVQFRVSSDEQSVQFEVDDKGCGIPELDMKRLFEPFHRSANVRNIEGTGLGLVIVQKYVELHRGTIQVTSTEGIGTTFSVRIPLVGV